MWALRSTVIHGYGRGGRLLGFPTANLELDLMCMRRLSTCTNGVFAGWGCVEGEDQPGEVYPFVMSVGFNPHFKNLDCTAEVYFIHTFPNDFYGSAVRILVCNELRTMSAFTTIEALIKMIRQDVEDALLVLRDRFWELKHSWFLTHPIEALRQTSMPQILMPYPCTPLSEMPKKGPNQLSVQSQSTNNISPPDSPNLIRETHVQDW